MAIQTNPITGNLFTTSSVSSNNWRVTAPYLYFFWRPQEATPAAFNQEVYFPDFSQINSFSAYTDWRFEVELIFNYTYIFITNSVIPFANVEGTTNHSEALGVADVDGFITKNLNYSFLNLNQLPVPSGFLDFSTPRVFNCISKLKVTALNSSGLRETISEKEFNFNFEILWFNLGGPSLRTYYPGSGFDALFQPLPFVFNYHQGGALPEIKDLYLFRNFGNNTSYPTTFNKSSTDLVTNFYSLHDYFSKIAVSFSSAITSLAIGSYNYSIELGYPSAGTFPAVTETINIVLNVLAPASDDVLPHDLTFNVVVGGALPQGQVLSIASSGSWSITSPLPNWLNISSLNGSGNQNIIVVVQNYQNLSSGTYNYTLVFDVNGATVNVPVVLNLQVFCEYPFSSGKIHFTKDLEYLKFTSQNNNTWVDINLTCIAYSKVDMSPKTYLRNYRVPLYNKKESFHIGSLVEQLFFDLEELVNAVPSASNNYFTPQYLPCKVSITWEEKEYAPALVPPVLESGGVSDVLFVLGNKPYTTNSQMCLLSVQQQEIINIKRNTPLGISFIHLGTPQVIVKVNGVVKQNLFLFSPTADRIINSYFLFNNDFQIGDFVELFVINGSNEIRVQRYFVNPDGLENTFLLFENSFGIVEPFHLSGKRIMSSPSQYTNAKKFKNLRESESKILTENVKSVVVNTGNLTEAEVKIIEEIRDSKNVWIAFNDPFGHYYKCDCTTNNIPIENTTVNEINYNLEFNLLEKYPC